MTIYWTSDDCDGQAILTLHLSVGQVILSHFDHCHCPHKQTHKHTPARIRKYENHKATQIARCTKERTRPQYDNEQHSWVLASQTQCRNKQQSHCQSYIYHGTTLSRRYSAPPNCISLLPHPTAPPYSPTLQPPRASNTYMGTVCVMAFSSVCRCTNTSSSSFRVSSVTVATLSPFVLTCSVTRS